jgi:polar amino acid transport system substrate-binding protein
LQLNKPLFSSLLAVGLLVSFGGGAASAGDLKCEPGKIASKYPSLAGKAIKIAEDGESPPYSMRDPADFNHLIGLDVDLARATFKCIGAPVEFVTGSWSGLLPAVIAGQADVMWDTLFYTPERAKKVDFVVEMSAASGVLVANGNPKHVTALDDACGLRGTAGLGTIEETQLRDLSAKCIASGKKAIEIITYPDIPGGTRLIQNDRADFMIEDLAMIDSIAGANPGLFDRAFAMKGTDRKAVGLTKNNTDLAKAIFDSLSLMESDGTAKAIFDQYHVDYGIVLPPAILTK